jgi:cobalt-zinc-cadmium efflux system membrane fusion protein
VVFVRSGGGFIPQPVSRAQRRQTRRDAGRPAPGRSYAAAGSFVLKSELGKASAEHSH